MSEVKVDKDKRYEYNHRYYWKNRKKIIKRNMKYTRIKRINKPIDKLLINAKKVIELLLERRTALISAAVTGKIDVRNWVAPEANKTNKEVAA